MRAVIYTRVSSQEQIDGYSLSAQREICTQFANGRAWEVVQIYEEPGRSGKTAHRPVFQRMIADAEMGKFDLILVHKLDRFSRSLLDVLTYLDRLGKLNVSFVSATEQFDFSTPFGKVILAMLGAFAQWYLDNLRAEIIKGKKERARQGGWNGTLSFGYTTPRALRERLMRFDLAEED
ncbi:MAG: recombinase family protein, partial [Chloroflexota bacterium]